MAHCPRPLNIYQVELTSFCDMKCSYCPHPTMKRGKGHMSEETLAKCIEHTKQRGYTRLVVHHFGEPLLHPKLKDRLEQIAASGLDIQFSTNGLLLEKKLPILLGIKAPIAITLSMHQWASQHPSSYFAALAQWRARVIGTNITFLKAFNVDETSQNYRFHRWSMGDDIPWDYYNHCFFLKDNWGVVMWNGDIVSCCVDAEGESVVGNIHDPNSFMAENKAWRGCDTCDIFAQYKEARKRVSQTSFFYTGATRINGLAVTWTPNTR